MSKSSSNQLLGEQILSNILYCPEGQEFLDACINICNNYVENVNRNSRNFKAKVKKFRKYLETLNNNGTNMILKNLKHNKGLQTLVNSLYGPPELVDTLPALNEHLFDDPKKACLSGDLTDKHVHASKSIRSCKEEIKQHLKNKGVTNQRTTIFINWLEQFKQTYLYGRLDDRQRYFKYGQFYECDFVTNKGILDFKASMHKDYLVNEIEDWTQVAFYSLLNNRYMYKPIWIFNPINGHLYCRRPTGK